MFVELTERFIGETVSINVRNVTYVRANKESSSIFFVGLEVPLEVREDADYIMNMINKNK